MNRVDKQISCLIEVDQHISIAAFKYHVTFSLTKDIYLLCVLILDLCVQRCRHKSVCHIAVAMQTFADTFGTAMLRCYWCGSWAQPDVQIERPFHYHSIILSDCLLVSRLWEDLLLPWTDTPERHAWLFDVIFSQHGGCIFQLTVSVGLASLQRMAFSIAACLCKDNLLV